MNNKEVTFDLRNQITLNNLLNSIQLRVFCQHLLLLKGLRAKTGIGYRPRAVYEY